MGFKWIETERIASTNSFLQELVRKKNSGDELVVTADYQTEGRGQGEKAWHSEPGKNLLMSLLLFPEFLSASRQFRLSMLISLSICDILDQEELEAVIKWPNDILTTRGKIAGILIENGIAGNNITHAVIGIGINLNQTSFPEFPLRATSLAMEQGRSCDRDALARRLVDRIGERYLHAKGDLGESLEPEYLDRLYLRDRTTDLVSAGRSFRGRIAGISQEGELLVEEGGRIQAFGTHQISIEVPSNLRS